jgi:TetR/AcrR family transcriptional repressor of nem operon
MAYHLVGKFCKCYEDSMVTASGVDTTQKILDVAARLIQTQGFNGFSYADIAEELAIQKASIHYHFPTKADLGKVLMERYRRSFGESLAAIEAGRGSARARLARYVQLYVAVLTDGNKMCLCGMLAADFSTLPKALRTAVTAFFDDNEAWLTRLLGAGRRDGSLAFRGTPLLQARLLLSSLEGAMLVARSYGEPQRLSDVAERLLADLAPPKR